ncbi:hypothetical protein [Mariniblastus fucicola]|uniref:Uncharacterized protein n=1 Tax=Mariniblastus fucicola TaxID=980251 RepID=A0A5B9P8I0_9BACT|nr:hypothetical protein [Mariniblastus fucicola]QEG22588.1 hypothetical protein MFFC18_24710 [Mariniblastus fucicola]
MGRRSSASNSTRLFQGLFALVWIGFLIYMITGYLKKSDDDPAIAGGDKPDVVTPGTDGDSSAGKSTFGDSKLATDSKLVLPTPGEKTVADAKTPPPPAGPTAREILNDTLAVYQNAAAYSDRGVLTAAHQIDGRRIKEDYPWRTAWARGGKLQLDIFDAEVRSDGNLLSCFVSEIRTENVKNQQLFLKGSQLVPQLYNDRIAAYYLNGGERIPVNETIVPNSTLLVPPAVSLLSLGTNSPWLTSTAIPKRLADSPIYEPNNGPDCYVIQCSSRFGNLVVWIDKKTSLIQQIKFPNSILDPMLAANPEVRELSLFAQFPGASLDASSVAFEPVKPRSGVWPVREFVAPTDPLPTNLLGEMVPEFVLLDSKRAKVTDRQIRGKPMAMLFLDGGDSDALLIEKFEAVRQSMGNAGINFAVVAGPGAIQQQPGGSWRPSQAIQPAVNRSKVPVIADLNGGTAKAFELASLPAVVSIDSKLQIQYADLLAKPAGYNGKLAISEKWDQRLASAMTATQKGVNVANDMKAKYRTYLDKYFADRDQRLVASYFPGYQLPGQQKIAAVPAKVRREQTAERSKLKLNPKLVWESDLLNSPGNIAMVPDANRRPKGLLILDGWQTVNLFSLDGKPVSRKRLELPDGVAVTSIRSIVSANGEQRFVMFSVGGKQVFVFDGSMQLIESYPKAQDIRHPVLACELLPGNSGASDKLLVCFGGTGGANIFDSFAGTVRSIGDTAVRALALSGQSVIAASERTGLLLSMDNGRVIDDQREYTHIVSGANGVSVFAATAMNTSGEWSLLLLDRDLKAKRPFPISSAVFDNGLEPVAGVSTGVGRGTWAVADSTNRIYLVSDDGMWLGDMAADGKVSGLTLMQVDGRTRLIVSTDRKVECWELNFAPERVGAVSGRVE